MNPSWFDENFYLNAKANLLNLGGGSYTATAVRSVLSEAGMTPYAHYTAYGDAEKLSPSAQFNRFEYLTAKAAQLNNAKHEGKTTWTAQAVSESLAKLGITAGEHYAAYGWKENINPSNDFDTSSYLASKLAQVRTLAGADGNGKPYAQYEQSDLNAAFAASGADPIGHYRTYGNAERIPTSPVPQSERVESDPARPKGPVLSADGKTVTIHLTSPVKATSIEAADFSLVLDGKEIAISKAAMGTGKPSYDVVLTLDDANRLPGLLEGESSTLHAVYNPNGGSKAKLETDAGPVNAFDSLVSNQSQCFTITERTTGTTTFTIKINAPVSYEDTDAPEAFVKVDLSATNGVVSGGTYGIVTPPRLMNGSLVNKFDATAVDSRVHLNIKAGTKGGEIATSDAADIITCGGGTDVIRFTSLINSQLDHMDTVDKFTYKYAAGDTTGDKLLFPTNTVDNVIFKGPLSLEGSLTEAAIQGVFGDTPMATKTGYVLQNGKDYLFVVDSDGNGSFEADSDFAVNLTGLTGLPTGLVPGNQLLGFIGLTPPTPPAPTP